ncbi:HWE histidine kinase domain-containing protein [Caulobacter sp. ErkDOM-E]|uniref:HWE histidine kinase domain-containing protein n=1 Tax=Caulobacter sp. ErkDOM-E TaxID=3402778 RepID=UPI003AF5AF78
MVENMVDPDSAHDTDKEAVRLRATKALKAFDRPGENPHFTRLIRLAARSFHAPRARLWLIGGSRLHCKVSLGFGHDGEVTRRAGSLADLLIALGEPLVCGNAATDARLTALSLPGIGFLGCAPLIDPDGQVVGFLTVEDPQPRTAIDPDASQTLIDLAALAMEALLRDRVAGEANTVRTLDSERLALAIGAASLGEFEWDRTLDIYRISPRLAKIAHLPAGEIPAEDGQSLFRYVHGDDRAEIQRDVDAQLRKRGRYEVEFRRNPDDKGRIQWNRAAGVMTLDEQGEPTRLIGVIQDITDRKQQDEQRESLLAELDHRIKNLLAVVQSVAAQSARKSSSLDVFLKTFAGRLKSMSSAHDLLSAARWRGATLARIAAAELGGLAPTQTRWDGPELFLTPRAASALSLTLHELAVNAVKFGALSTENGKVEVVWRRSPDGGFALEWLETGGPPATEPTKRGFGATLVEDVVGRELGGRARIDYRRSGVSALIQAAAHALADGPPPEPEKAAPERIVETLIAADENIRPGAIAGLRVLIVEDSLLLALELESGLEDAGVVVVGCAAELGEALSMLDQAFDVAVLDADLNGQSVAPVAEILRGQGRPFVFATGYADKAAPMGFDAPIVRKPYNVHQIARAIADVTGRH